MELLNDPTLQIIGAIVGTALGFLLRLVYKDRASKAESNFSLGVHLAYDIVNEISLRTGNKIDDKVALGLKHLRDFLATKGQPLSDTDAERAKLLFQALHGQELAAKKE